MGMMTDYTVRFTGDEEALERARAVVARARDENARGAGCGVVELDAEPEDVPGGFQWQVIATEFGVDDDRDATDVVEELMSESPLRLTIHVYMEPADNGLGCRLSTFDCFDADGPANNRFVDLDDVVLGIDAALAYDRCEEGDADEADLPHLLARFERAWLVGCVDEDDTAWLPTAGACARALWLGLQRLPADSPAWGAVEALEEDILAARKDLAGVVKKRWLRDIDALLTEIARRKIHRASATSDTEGSEGAGAGGGADGKGKKAKGCGSERKVSGPTTI